MSPWKAFRYRLEELACLAVERAVPRLSRERSVKLGLVLGDLAYFFDRRGRRVAEANLECVFGDRYTPAQRRWIARLSYRNFTRTMVDLFWSVRLSTGNYQDYVDIEGFTAVRERMAREKRGAIFMCVHEGNWEWSNYALGFEGLRNVAVTENFKNPRLTAIFDRMRQASGQSTIPQENSLFRMLRLVERGRCTGMLIDLNLRPSQAAAVINAFGLCICGPLLHAVLAQRAGALLVPVETLPDHQGRCRIIAHPPLEPPPGASLPQIAQACWDFFEPRLRARPDLWLWAYKHFRYKPKDATREYPFYANESSAFEKLRKAQAAGSVRSGTSSGRFGAKGLTKRRSSSSP